MPVDRICDLGSLPVCSLIHEFKHLLCSKLILVFVHCVHLINLIYTPSRGALYLQYIYNSVAYEMADVKKMHPQFWLKMHFVFLFNCSSIII